MQILGQTPIEIAVHSGGREAAQPLHRDAAGPLQLRVFSGQRQCLANTRPLAALLHA